MKFIRIPPLFILLFSTLLGGCATPFPKVEPDFQKDWQGTKYEAQVYLLPSAPEAFATRIKLINEATTSIDITYFSWNGDTLGLMLLDTLKKAADRGVKVRIALDDLLVFKEQWLADIDSHENIEINIFNPFNSRAIGWLGRSVDFVSNREQLNNRLHEKYFNVDHEFLILGGRNIGDEYFGYSQTANFFDMDVLFKGPVISAFEDNYDRLWQSGLLVPIAELFEVKKNEKYSNFNALYAKMRQGNGEVIDNVALTLSNMPAPDFMSVEVIPVFDSFKKMQDSLPYFRSRAETLIDRELQDSQKVTISTPYIVPTNGEFKVISALTAKGTEVTLLTNSSASNDSLFVPAYYEVHRETLLGMGVNIHEYKDQAKNHDYFYHGDSYYHNKTIIVDNEVSYIGSSNFDPRSDFTNIEFGLFVYSPAFAQQVHDYLLKDKSHLYWRVSRTAQGEIEWRSNDEVYNKNPNYSNWNAFPDWIFRKMNAESEL
jgi:putative cardiolipin synthase